MFGTVEVVVFPRDYGRFKHLIVKDAKVLIKGNASVTEEEGKLLLSQMYTFEEIKSDILAEKKEVWICFDNEAHFNECQGKFLNILGQHKGRTEVWVQLRNPRMAKRMGDRYKVLANEELISQLSSEWGNENVLVREKKS